LVHALRVLVLDSGADLWLVRALAFIPIRETQPTALGLLFPGGDGARVWSFVTYALLHADWGHLAVNALWLAAFGSPLAWRFGALRFLLFSAAGAVAGALAHMAVYPHEFGPMVGASAAISAQMAGAARFVFQTGGPLWARTVADPYRRPASPLVEIVRDRRVLAFLGVWFAINIVFGLTGGAGLAEGGVAWDAHIGGFIAGLLLFRFFDPVPAAR
jgi:membrane associated rhomboid family serine protease